MSTSKSNDKPIGTLVIRIGVVLVGLALIAVLLSPTVKAWLNGIPNFWRIFYPLLALFSGYLVVSAIRTGDGAVEVVKWLILLLATLSATAFAYGAPRLFFTVGRVGAIAFIAVEVLHMILEGVSEYGAGETA